FFAHNNCKGSDNSTKRQASGISHENLRRISIVPQKAYTGTNKRGYKNCQFTQIRDVHNVQVFGNAHITAYKHKHTQTQTNDRTDTSSEAIQPVGYICSV